MSIVRKVGLFMLKHENIPRTDTTRLLLLRDAVRQDISELKQRHGSVLNDDTNNIRIPSKQDQNVVKQYNDFVFYLNQIERELEHRNAI